VQNKDFCNIGFQASFWFCGEVIEELKELLKWEKGEYRHLVESDE
jgi:hypothetical protein